MKERGLNASSIQPRPLEQVTTTKNRPIIRQIAVFIADIDGMEKKIVAYVILGQIDNIILGKGWMERHDVSIRPAKGQVCIRKPFKIIVKSRAITSESIEEIRAKTIQALQASNEVMQIFSVSLANIQKALTQKEYRDPAQYALDWLMPSIDKMQRYCCRTRRKLITKSILLKRRQMMMSLQCLCIKCQRINYWCCAKLLLSY